MSDQESTHHCTKCDMGHEEPDCPYCWAENIEPDFTYERIEAIEMEIRAWRNRRGIKR